VSLYLTHRGIYWHLYMVIKEVLDEWDAERNGSPDSYSDSSNKKVWWICRTNPTHRWQATVNNRKKSKCPYCSGRIVTASNSLAKHVNLVKEIHKKNGVCDPCKIAQFSHKKLWWLCELGHEWKAEIASRVSGQGCPFCKRKKPTSANNLAVIFPEIAKEWSDKNDTLPNDYLPFSKIKVWWICSKGHEWKATISDRTLSGSGCHECSGYNKQIKCEESDDGTKKVCNFCHKMKSKDDFRHRKGYWVNSVCKQCESEKVLQYRTMTPDGVVAEILRRKRHICSKQNLPFNLTKEFLLQRLNSINWKCELTGLPLRAIKTSLDEHYQGFHLDSISLDRIDHKGGYTQDNVRVVLNQVNIFRSSGSDERMYQVAEALLRHKKEKHL
jgi:hypothetical protein